MTEALEKAKEALKESKEEAERARQAAEARSKSKKKKTDSKDEKKEQEPAPVIEEVKEKEADLFLPKEFGGAMQKKMPRPFIFGPVSFKGLD